MRPCDLVFCVDATGAMGSVWGSLPDDIPDAIEAARYRFEKAGYEPLSFRVRIVGFRDFRVDPEAIFESRFYQVPEEYEELFAFIRGVWAHGGGDLPESGLEAISLALKSDWTTEGMKQRHVVLMFTDAAALPLGTGSDKPGYPAGMPADLAQLGAWWEGADQTFTGTYKPKAGRLIAFAPNAEPWTSLETWNRYWPTYSNAGTGLSEVDMETVYDLLVGSC